MVTHTYGERSRRQCFLSGTYPFVMLNLNTDMNLIYSTDNKT